MGGHDDDIPSVVWAVRERAPEQEEQFVWYNMGDSMLESVCIQRYEEEGIRGITLKFADEKAAGEFYFAVTNQSKVKVEGKDQKVRNPNCIMARGFKQVCARVDAEKEKRKEQLKDGASREDQKKAKAEIAELTRQFVDEALGIDPEDRTVVHIESIAPSIAIKVNIALQQLFDEEVPWPQWMQQKEKEPNSKESDPEQSTYVQKATAHITQRPKEDKGK